MDKFDIIKSYLLDEGFAETEEAAIGMMVSMSESWKEEILEIYKGKHGQSDKEYMDGRSDAGKQISGDSKMSGAAYSHRSFKGQGKPAKPGERQKAQGRMTQADRDELAIRKAALKKEEIELDENRRAARSAGGYKDDSKKQTDPSKDGFTGISGSIKEIMRQNKEIEAKKKKMSEASDPRDEAAMKKFQELQKNVDQKKKKESKKLPHMGTGNPHYDAKSAGISRVKDFKFTPVKEEVEVEEGYKEIDKAKENRMYRRAGNLARTSLSSTGEKKKDAASKSAKIVSAITRQKENERFAKMADEKARDNYVAAEEVEQVDEALPLLAAVPALLAKGAAAAGKVGAVAAKGAAMAGKAGATAAKAGAKTSGLGMKGKLKLKMKDMAKDAIKSKAQDMASDVKDTASSAVTDNNPLNSLKNSHEPQGEQIHEISAETALAASKGRDRQAMMLKGPEHTEKRAELRAKASQNYDRAVKKRKAGYVKNTASPQGPARKMTAESMSDIAALRAEMLKEEKE